MILIKSAVSLSIFSFHLEVPFYYPANKIQVFGSSNLDFIITSKVKGGKVSDHKLQKCSPRLSIQYPLAGFKIRRIQASRSICICRSLIEVMNSVDGLI